MNTSREEIQSPADLLPQYTAATRIGAGLAAFVPSVGLVDVEKGDIARAGNSYNRKGATQEDKDKKTREAHKLIKNRFHKSGFIALLFDDNPHSREVLDVLAINIGLKSNTSLVLDVLSDMHSLFLRAVEVGAVNDRPSIFRALQDIFRKCEGVTVDSDFYKMAAIALAQFMLTQPCFTRSRWTNDISIPKTWKLVLMEARVFIGSLSDAEDRQRVLSVFKAAIKRQEENFVEAVRQHPQIVKIKSDEMREKNIARFKLTLADCSELFNPIEPFSPQELRGMEGMDEETRSNRSDSVSSVSSVLSTMSDVVNADLKSDARQVKSDLKAFKGAKEQFIKLLRALETGNVRGNLEYSAAASEEYVIAAVDGYLRQHALVEVQSASKSFFSPGNLTTVFGSKLYMAHPSLVWLQLVAYARLLAEKNVQSTSCLARLYEIIGDMARCKGWGPMLDQLEYLKSGLKKKPLIQFDFEDDAPSTAVTGSNMPVVRRDSETFQL